MTTTETRVIDLGPWSTRLSFIAVLTAIILMVLSIFIGQQHPDLWKWAFVAYFAAKIV